MKRIYLDNNATTPLAPEVISAMQEVLGEAPLNPSSPHSFGRDAKQKLQRARETLAHFFHVSPSEVVFTSGGTESITMALKGFGIKERAHIITSDAEHSAVEANLTYLEKRGARVTRLPVGLAGAPTVEAVAQAITPETKLIALMSVNNITGIKTDIASVSELAASYDIPLFVDAVSHIGKEPFPPLKGKFAIALSAHKFHGPIGIGCLILSKGFTCEPLIIGGDQEGKRRAGTENLIGIVGLAKALELVASTLPDSIKTMRELRDRLLSGLPPHTLHGTKERLCNTASIAFPGIEAEVMMMQLDLEGIAVGYGSACSSGSLEPPRTLLNMGISPEVARSSLRFSLSRYTTSEEIERVIEVVTRLRASQNR